MYVGTDPEVDSPALAGVFNAPDPFFTAPCIWQPLVRCSAEEYRIIFSASWFDSGYIHCQSIKAWFFTYFYVGLLGSCGRSSSALFVDICSGMSMAGFAGYVASCAVFAPLLGRPVLPGTVVAGFAGSMHLTVFPSLSAGPVWIAWRFRILRNAWFDSGYMYCVSNGLRYVLAPCI